MPHVFYTGVLSRELEQKGVDMQRCRLLKLIRRKRKIIWLLLSIFMVHFCLFRAYSSYSESCFKTEWNSAASGSAFLVESALGDCEHVLNKLTGYCAKSFEVKDFAIAVHLGDRTNSLRQGGIIYAVLKTVGTIALIGKVDVYVNIRQISQLEEIKLFDIWKKCRNLHPIYTLQRNNAGMDIGGFFNSMLAISQRCRIYKLILKLHSKEDQNWLRNAVHPLVGTSAAVATLLNTFLNESNKIGIVAGLPTHPFNCSVKLSDRLFFGYALGDIDHLSSTMPHEDKILEKFGARVPRHKRMFHAGSMFGINGVMLSEVLPAEKIKKVLFELNDPNTLDLNWFRIMARITGDSIAVKQSYYYRFNTWKRHTPGNSIVAHHQRGILADGQVEHAWERIFFYLPFLSGRSIALQFLDQNQNHANMILPKDMDLSSMDETKCFHNTFHYEECRKSSNATAMCFLYANYGECLLRPSYMHQNCEDICSCSRTNRTDHFHYHKVQLAFITNMRSAGPFNSVSKKYANIFQCILHRKKHHTLAFPPIGDEIYFSSKMHITGCARLETMNSRFQALIDERGFLYIYNFQAELLWSTEKSKSHFLKWFRNHLLTSFQFKRRLSNSKYFVLHGNKQGLHISNLSLYQVLQCYSHWCSHPFILTSEGTRVLKLDDTGCLILRSSFGSMLEQQLWSSCTLTDISY